MSHDNLERPNLEQLDWSAQQRSDSLSRLHDHAVDVAEKAERWYARKRPSKKRWGRALRVGAIALGVAAAIVPVLAQITATAGKPAIPPAWAAVALAIAAGMVAFDRYFGFSAAWMRFMVTELAITRRRHGFEYDWELLRTTASEPPDDAHVAAAIALAREFVIGVDDLLAGETATWTTEFQSSLEQAEQRLQAARP